MHTSTSVYTHQQIGLLFCDTYADVKRRKRMFGEIINPTQEGVNVLKWINDVMK